MITTGIIFDDFKILTQTCQEVRMIPVRILLKVMFPDKNKEMMGHPVLLTLKGWMSLETYIGGIITQNIRKLWDKYYKWSQMKKSSSLRRETRIV